MATKKRAVETVAYSRSVPLSGDPMGPGFVVRVVVEPAADRAFTADELEHLERVLPDAGIDPGALVDGSLKPSKRAAKKPSKGAA